MFSYIVGCVFKLSMCFCPVVLVDHGQRSTGRSGRRGSSQDVLRIATKRTRVPRLRVIVTLKQCERLVI
uniref:Secreted protein n=1 Tax=Pararge aegeria TaxID=116150 RepID=S4PZK3_9NEOP